MAAPFTWLRQARTLVPKEQYLHLNVEAGRIHRRHGWHCMPHTERQRKEHAQAEAMHAAVAHRPPVLKEKRLQQDQCQKAQEYVHARSLAEMGPTKRAFRERQNTKAKAVELSV
jgi:translation elongation factor EF-Ts